MPGGLAFRILLGLVIGTLLVFVLQGLVASEPAAAARPDTAAATPASGAARRSPAVLRMLRGPGALLIYLCGPDREPPAGVAPVVEIVPGGRLRLLRPPPPAEAPRDPWLAAALVLRPPTLGGLSAEERVAVLDVCSALADGRRLTVSQLVPWGLDATPAQRRSLLRWLR